MTRTKVRALAAPLPADPEEERKDWEESFSIIPDFEENHIALDVSYEPPDSEQAVPIEQDDEPNGG